MPGVTDHPLYWTLREIARLERGGLRPPRLTEKDQERWVRVRRKLGWVAFIELLHEDLATSFPTAFALDRWSSHPTAGALRQFMDAMANGELPGLYLVVTGTRDFFEGYKGLKNEPALFQRVSVKFDDDPRFDNQRAAQVRLHPFDGDRLLAVGRRIRDLYPSEQPSRIQAKVGDAFLRSLVDQVTTGFGGKVAVAPRLFLRELTDILDRVDQHQDFDPAVHYKLTVQEDELRPEELAAIRGEAAPADEEIDEAPPALAAETGPAGAPGARGKGPRRLDG